MQWAEKDIDNEVFFGCKISSKLLPWAMKHGSKFPDMWFNSSHINGIILQHFIKLPRTKQNQIWWMKAFINMFCDMLFIRTYLYAHGKSVNIDN